MSELDEHVLPNDRPERIDLAVALALRDNPPRAGQWAEAVRDAYFGKRALLRPTPGDSLLEGPAMLLRRHRTIRLDVWPAPAAWQPGDRVAVIVEPGDELTCRRYVEWLLQLAEHVASNPIAENPWLGPCSLAPWSRQPGGTARLWAIAVARLILPASVRVEARHDLIGIRLAQVALGFGADTLAGPIEADRKLPVAGVTRPTEPTITGLRNLIEQAGLEPALQEDAVPRTVESGRFTVSLDLRELGLPADPDEESQS